MKLNVIIADDEALARRLMEDYVKKSPGLNLVAKCSNGVEVLEALRQHDTDLLLLDIQMPGLTGIELVRSLKKRPMVIFTTAYSDYALEGFELDVIDYLVKPIALERFLQAVHKAIDYHELLQHSSQAPATPETPAIGNDFFFVKSGKKLVRIAWKEIECIEGLKEYVGIRTATGRTVTLASLKDLEVALPRGEFVRVHKSWIVRVDQIDHFADGSLSVKGREIPVGRSFRAALLEVLEGKGI